jgi:hypothetical protein
VYTDLQPLRAGYDDVYVLDDLCRDLSIPLLLRRAFRLIRKINLIPYLGFDRNIHGINVFSYLQELYLTSFIADDMQ